MLTAIEQFDLSQILQPVQRPEDARQDAVKWAANLTIRYGTAVSRKTADNLIYPLAPGQSDGTQTFVGLAMYTFKTDASGLVYYGPTATPGARLGPYMTSPIWVTGIFDPNDLITNAGALATQVLTFTPGGTITTGDVNKLTFVAPDLTSTVASFTVGATTTAAAVSAGLIAAWNANPTLAAIATATGTTTVILTSVNSASADGITSSVTGVGTLTKATTTASAGRSFADITGGRPGAMVLHNGFWWV